MKASRTRNLLISAALTAFLSGFATARAADLVWDNGTGNSLWDTTSTNWSGTAVWNNATPDSAVFGATGIGTVSLTNGITANSITFNNAGFTIAGGTLTLGGPTPSITNNADASISSVLAGSAGLVKAGSGKLTLSGANTYTGNTTNSQGNITFNNVSAFGPSGAVVLGGGTGNAALFAGVNGYLARNIIVNPQTGGTVTIGDPSTFSATALHGFSGNITLSGDVTLQSGPDNIGNRTDFPGSITGTGNVTINDPTSSNYGIIFGNNSANPSLSNIWSGNLTINAGSKLQLGAGTTIGNGIPDTATVTVNGLLSLARNANETIDALNGTGSITRNATTDGLTVGAANGSGNFAGVISGVQTTVMLTKTGTGTQTLTGTNTYAGGTTINGGTLTIGGAGQLGSGSYAGALVANGTFIYNSSANQILSGVISGNGIITNAGPGKLTISTASTFTGALTVNDGAALGVTVSGSSQLPPATLTEGSSAGPTTNEFTGVFSPSLAPVKAGTLVLKGTTTINIISGSFLAGQIYPLIAYTTISGTGNFVVGTLPAGISATVVTNNSSIALNVTAAPPAFVWAGNVDGTWDINTTSNWLTNGVSTTYLDASLPVLFDDTASTFTVNNVAVVSPGGFGTLINNTTNAYTIGGSAIAGAGGLIKSGTNMLTLTGANTYTGATTISAGGVTIPTGGAIASGSAISIGSSGTLNYTMLGATLANPISGAGVLNLTPSDSSAVRTFDLSGNKTTFAGTMNYNAGAFGNITVQTTLPGSSSTINIAPGGELLVNNGMNYSGNMILSGNGIVGGANPPGNGRAALALYQATISGNIALNGNASIQAGNAGGASTISATINTAGNTLTFTNNTTASGAVNVTGAITNSGSVAVGYSSSGAFTLTLSSTANNYTGSTTVSSPGTLTLGNNNVIPNGVGYGNVTVNGTLNVNGKTETINGLSGSGAINGTGTLTVGDNNATSTFGGVISSALALAKTGTGTVTLTGVNTYSGTTTVNAGKLVVSAAQTGTGAITVSDNATLGLTASGASRLSPTSLTVGTNAGATLEFSVTSTTVAPLTPVAITLNGTPKINIASCPPAIGVYPLASNYTASVPTLNSLPVGVAGNLSVSGNVLYLNVTGVLVDYWTGAVNGNWDLATANWTNSQAGNLFVNGAPVQFNDTAAGASPLAVTVTAGGVSPGVMVVSNGAKNYVFGGGAIGGSSGLTKSGSGTLTMTNVNTYSGGTTLNGGVVSFGNGGLGTAGTVSFATNATLQWNGANTQDLSSRLSIANGVTASLDTMSNTVAFATAFGAGGSGGLTKLGSGTLTLSGVTGVNTYTGPTTVSNGVLTVNNWLGLSGNPGSYTGAVMVASETTLNLTAAYALYEFLSGPLSGAGTINATPFAGGGYRFSGDGTAFTGTVNANVANGNLFAGSTTVLNAAVNVVGNSGVYGFTALSGTTAQIGSLSGTGIVGADAGTCTFQVGNLNTDTTFSGAIKNNVTTGGGVAGLTKVGTGTLSLSGINTYTGPTTVNGGTLQVDGSLASGTAVAVNGGTLQVSGTVNGTVTGNGGIVRGTGTINGATEIKSGGKLAAGTTTNFGTLTIVNTLILDAGSTNVMRIDKNAGIPQSDLLQGMSSVVLNGTLVVADLTTNGNALAANDTFYIFGSGGFSGSFTGYQLPVLPAGLSWDTSQLAVGGNGSIAVVNRTATPLFSPPPMDYPGGVIVTITSDTGARIFYTTNGATPTTASPSGISPVNVAIGANSTNLTITAYATNSAAADSAVASATYSTMAAATWTAAAGFDGSGSWANAANWSNSVIANGSSVTADFSTLALPNGDASVTLDGAWTIGGMIIGDTSGAYNWYFNTGGPLTLDAGTNTPAINVLTNSATFGVVLAGAKGLTKTGPGTLALSAANTYPGATVISNGTLEVNGSIASTNIVDNGVLAYTYSGVDKSINASISGSGAINADAGSGSITFSGTVNVGSVAVTAGTAGLLTDIVTTSNQSYSGLVYISRGSAADTTTLTTTAGGGVTLLGGAAGAAANYATCGTLNIDTSVGNGAVTLGGVSQGNNLGNLNVTSGTGPIALSGGTYRYADYSLFNGPVSLDADSVFQWTGSAWVRGVKFGGDLTGAFTLTGNFGSGGALSSGAGINGLVFNTATASTVSSTLAGTTGLTKTGAGATTLTAANTYTGATVVSNGTLLVNGSLAAGSAVSVAPAGTLGGTGTVNGPVTVNGTVSPGASIGTLTTGAEAWYDGSKLVYQVASADTNSNAGRDLLTINGTLDLQRTNSGVFTIKLVSMANNTTPGNVPDFNSSSNYTWTVGTATALANPGNLAYLTLDTSAFGNAHSGTFSLAFDIGAQAIQINYTAQTVSTTQPHLTNSVSGGSLYLSWPADHLGWRLEKQNNPRSVGLSNNWVTVPGSSSLTATNLPINPANPTEFYRLVYP